MVAVVDGVRYSIVIPICNEEESLPELCTRLRAVMDRLDGDWEAILVDDGSTDRSFELMDAERRSDERFRLIGLSRSFGQQVAITAGLEHAAGDAVIIMDGDLQDPPETIPDLIARWKEGHEVVYAIRTHRAGESSFKRQSARFYYRMLNRIAEIESPVDAGDFRLLDRRALNALHAMPERNRYVRGMISWIGFRQTGVAYERHGRFAGDSKYPLKKMSGFAVDGIVGFSTVPLRLALGAGLVFSALAFVGALWALIARISGAYVVPGWTSLACVTFFFGGVQLLVLGIMGEYIARIHEEVKRRPLYVVRDKRGFGERSENMILEDLSGTPSSR
jgi:dolichol-phosphate mannosyltransferase